MDMAIFIELLPGITTFVLVNTITPGPNNIMLTASGANFGFKRTLPHIAGIIIGVAALNLCTGLGLGALFTQFPLMQHILRVLGSAYLIWLAIKLLNFQHSDDDHDSEARPFSFWQTFFFQYVNPKVWVMVVYANASFSLSGADYWPSVWFITLIFALIGPPSIMLWAGFGQLIRHALKHSRVLKAFNILMAGLTASCVLFIWMD